MCKWLIALKIAAWLKRLQSDIIFSCVCILSLFQVIRTQLEEKRTSVEQSLETGRLYLREEGLEDKRLSADSGEGIYLQLAFPALLSRWWCIFVDCSLVHRIRRKRVRDESRTGSSEHHQENPQLRTIAQQEVGWTESTLQWMAALHWWNTRGTIRLTEHSTWPLCFRLTWSDSAW